MLEGIQSRYGPEIWAQNLTGRKPQAASRKSEIFQQSGLFQNKTFKQFCFNLF